MIDPFIQLAFNIHSSPGVFALLLGSGVSRSAEIPTGWEVMLELIRKVAALESADCEPDPEKWYAECHGEEPNYSSLLDRLAPTPALRQQLLRSYFEPTEDERDQGKKLPTRAHHAITSLVRSGALRVIITINFDRLIETALEAGGITPTIISSPDDVDGATPIVHAGCTVIKVHGDYLDTRIKNSPSELECYDERMDRLLDRVLDDFGLIVCGWSAQYDTALRTAIRRAPSRRYPMSPAFSDRLPSCRLAMMMS
jgi:SIR2-like domain